jgi:hypothetical protein
MLLRLVVAVQKSAPGNFAAAFEEYTPARRRSIAAV